MKFKKAISMVMTVMFAFGTIPVVNAVYPSSSLIVNFGEQESVTGTQSWTASPNENIFSVDGKKFILLDTDDEGNYFVLSEEHYGGYPIEKGASSSVLIETAITDGGNTTFTKSGLSVLDNENGLFNPERQSNVAYWLNNGFITNGNSSKYIFPKSVYDNILEREWEVEGYGAYRGWKAKDYYDDYFGVTSALDYAASVNRNSYTVSAKLSLLSYTEYKQYKDKIGIEFMNSGGWAGMLLRTSDALVAPTVSNAKRTLTAYQAPLMVRNFSADKKQKNQLIIGFAELYDSNEYFIRPCFWLDKDFFKKVACDIEKDFDGNVNIGSYPLSMIKKHSYSELNELYSDAILEALGYVIPSMKFRRYPEHPQYSNMEAQETLSRNGYSKTNENYIFEVEGKKFILLDIDEEGNYFVLTEDLYGKRAFDTSFQPDTNGNNRNGSYTVEKINTSTGECVPVANAFDINEIKFSTTDTNNIGYWLNNGFLINGNGTGKILPESIKENLLMTEWAVEGMNCAVMDWTATRYDNEIKKQASGANKAKEFVIEPFTVTSKIALMSATEYKAYQDIIGFEHNEDTWKGMMLRTPRIQMFGTTWNDGNVTWEYLKFGWANVMVKNNGTDKATSMNQKMVMVHNDMPHAAEMFVRPCFWLDKDFFKNTIIDASKIGDAVKKVIAGKYDYYDLRNIYTDSQIEAFGILKESDTTNAIPTVKNLIIDGQARTGNEVSGAYKYIANDVGNKAASERNSIYKWYVSENAESVGTIVANTRDFKITEDLENKYITFSVTPVNAWGMVGEEKYSKPSLIRKGNVKISEIVLVDANGNKITSVNSYNEITAEIIFEETCEGTIIFAIYDVDGKLLKLTSSDIEKSDNTISLKIDNVSPTGGAYAKVIIFESKDMMTAVYSKNL